jgi:hypothetical protein
MKRSIISGISGALGCIHVVAVATAEQCAIAESRLKSRHLGEDTFDVIKMRYETSHARIDSFKSMFKSKELVQSESVLTEAVAS